MKTQLEPFSLELAAVLGTKHSNERYITVRRQASTNGCKQYVKPMGHEARIALARIDAALDRLELGTFGLCTHCGDEISLKRLDLDPSVPRCKGCEEQVQPTSR